MLVERLPAAGCIGTALRSRKRNTACVSGGMMALSQVSAYGQTLPVIGAASTSLFRSCASRQRKQQRTGADTRKGIDELFCLEETIALAKHLASQPVLKVGSILEGLIGSRLCPRRLVEHGVNEMF